jgi:hypothetical protein
MKLRQGLIVFVAAVLGLGVGVATGYRVSQAKAENLDQQRLDLARAIRGADLQNRLSTLRLLRDRKVVQEEIPALEISAIVLLQAIDLEDLPTEGASRVVLEKAAETLTAYRRDFPENEFNPTKHTAITKLLSLKRESGR